MDTKRIALFIDADNAPAKKIEAILSELTTLGQVNIRRIYGNWKNPGLKSWEDVLLDNALQPVQQFDLTKGKNATDIALVIDAMDVIYTREVDIVALVTSDCDFAPLATRILADGKLVYGFGERKTPAAFVNSCTRFLYLDEEPQAKTNAGKPRNLKGDSRLMNLLRDAVESASDEEGWALLGPVGSHIANQSASFDPRNYGYKRLSDLFLAIDLFEMKRVEGGNFRVRNRRAK